MQAATRILALALCMHSLFTCTGVRSLVKNEGQTHEGQTHEGESDRGKSTLPAECEFANLSPVQGQDVTQRIRQLAAHRDTIAAQKQQLANSGDFATAAKCKHCETALQVAIDALQPRAVPPPGPFTYEGCDPKISTRISQSCPFQAGELVKNADEGRLRDWATTLGVDSPQTFAANSKLFIMTAITPEDEEASIEDSTLQWGQPNPQFGGATTMDAISVYLCGLLSGDEAKRQIAFLLKKNFIDRMWSHGATSTEFAQSMYKELKAA